MNLQLVTLSHVADSLQNPEVWEMFSKMVMMKYAGYQDRFLSDGKILPFDGADYIGRHQIVCSKTKDGLVPLMTYRSVTYQECSEYNMKFPALTTLCAGESLRHTNAIKTKIHDWLEKGYSIGYDGAFTICPSVKNNPELGLELHKIVLGLGVHHRNFYNIDRSLMGAALKWKTDVTFKRMGSFPLSDEKGVLPSVYLPFARTDMLVLYCERKFSTKAIRLADKYQTLWDDRQILGEDNLHYEKIEKAA